MKINTCPHCGREVEISFDFCTHCQKRMISGWTPDETFVSMRQRLLRKRILLFFALSIASCIIVAIGGAVTIGVENNAKTLTNLAASNNRVFNGNCAGILFATDDVLVVLGGAGDTSTVQDITEKLKSNSALFLGYSQLATDGAQENLLRDISVEILQLRVALTDDGDYQTPALALKSNFLTVKELCRNR